MGSPAALKAGVFMLYKQFIVDVYFDDKDDYLNFNEASVEEAMDHPNLQVFATLEREEDDSRLGL